MNKRRVFLAGLLGLSSTTLWPKVPQITQESKPKLIGKKLKPGAKIKLIAPGFAIDQHKLEIAIEGITQMGYQVLYDETILNNHGYFSNEDEFRASEINAAFANPNIDAIICARGGYGSTRILDQIDYKLIASNPKALVGFSDITALLNAIHQKTGLIGFHGPVGSSLNNDYSRTTLNQLLSAKKAARYLKSPVDIPEDQLDNSEYERYTIYPGTARGKAVGGSLTLMTAMMGTPFEIDFTDSIVFIEDVGEKPYRIDRMLTQLLSSKSFKNAAGIVFGVCIGCDVEDSSRGFRLKEVVMDRIKPLQIPALYGMSFGHIPENFTIPIGAQVSVDTTSRTIELLEKVVA
jgi:muramoyltetrapeptide carboxypeptidase